MEIPAKKSLLYKYIQQECSSQEVEEVRTWLKEDGQDAALHEILNEAWEELQLYPPLEAEISEEIFQHVCHTAGISNSSGPVEVKKETLPAANFNWLFAAATIALLLLIVAGLANQTKD